MLYGIVNVFVYLESLRVIDLLKKGTYNIKIKCSRETDPNSTATPIISYSNRASEPNHNLKDPEITLPYYSSKKFYIQYVNEFILIGNALTFQIEIPFNEFLSHSLIVDVELVFHSFEKTSIVPVSEERVVSQQRLKITKPGLGIQQYFPITFSDWYFCLLKMMFSSSLVGFVFKTQTIDWLLAGSSALSLIDLGNMTSSISVPDENDFAEAYQCYQQSLSSPSLPSVSSPRTQGKKSQSLRSSLNSSPTGTSGLPKSQESGSPGGTFVQPPSINLDDFLDGYFEKRYPEISSHFIESYYRLSKKFKVLLTLLKQSQIQQLGDIVNISPLNIPPVPVSVSLNSSGGSINVNSQQQQQQQQQQQPQNWISSKGISEKSKRKSFLRMSGSFEIGQLEGDGGSQSVVVEESSAESPSLRSSEGSVNTWLASSPSSPSPPNPEKQFINTMPPPLPKWKKILESFKLMGDQIRSLWGHFVLVFQMCSRESLFKMSIRYEKKCIEKWTCKVQRFSQHIQSMEDLLIGDNSPPTASFLHNTEFFNFKPFKIHSIPFKIDSIYHSPPIFFENILKFHNSNIVIDINAPRRTEEDEEEDYENSPNSGAFSARRLLNSIMSSSSYNKHLFIFVHGLSGNQYDLRQFKNYFALHFPNALFLMCSSIEENTLEGIQQMGTKIALEVDEYLRNNLLQNQIAKISFIGHSLGGLVIRSALASPCMRQYHAKLHTYISLSTPHLGTKFYTTSSIVTPALWVWQKFSNSLCLKQLLMQDAADPLDCFLYRLSESSTLQYFQYIFLLSSEQDNYVPFHSARIEIPKDAGNYKEKHNSILKTMIENLLEPIRLKHSLNPNNNNNSLATTTLEKLMRINVIFDSHKGVDGVIGRAAHIRLLDHPWFMQMFVQLYKNHWES